MNVSTQGRPTPTHKAYAVLKFVRCEHRDLKRGRAMSDAGVKSRIFPSQTTPRLRKGAESEDPAGLGGYSKGSHFTCQE
jgi:hypothetical protein